MGKLIELLGGSKISPFVIFAHIENLFRFKFTPKTLLCSGKATLVSGGRSRDGTAFGGHKVEQLCKELSGAGYHYAGKDFMMSGITGGLMCGV